MSKVQSPKSHTEASANASAVIQGDDTDLGPWTSDFGPSQDLGLVVTDLRKSFLSPGEERIEVLRGVSFAAAAGETLAIMGSSGAGKSTLLHLLGGLEAADHGTVTAGRFQVDSANRSALARFRNHRVGYIFQFHHLLPDLTAAENVSLPLMISRTTRGDAMRRATQALEAVGLGSRTSHLVGHLSGGEQQRVAVCRALIARPSLVLADEPTGNLDAAIGDEIAHSLISYAHDNGAVLIVATHNRGLAEACDRILLLKEGRLCED